MYPFALLAEAVNLTTPRLLINREIVGSIGTHPCDVVIKNDVVEGTEFLAKKIGWYDDLIQLMNTKSS